MPNFKTRRAQINADFRNLDSVFEVVEFYEALSLFEKQVNHHGVLDKVLGEHRKCFFKLVLFDINVNQVKEGVRISL